LAAVRNGDAGSADTITEPALDGGELPTSENATPDSLVGYRLRRVHGAFVEAWKAFFGALGVTVTPVQGGILMLIASHPGLTQTELARRLRIETPTLHESVRRLIDAGLIERESLAHDRRAHALNLTVEGETVATLLRTRIDEQEAAALAPLTDAERAQLADLLGRVLAGRN
jgi:DNA-binding MarR family transcriptional regulator